MDKHSEIAGHAYFIWERRGCPQALDCWLDAEAELKAADIVREHMHKVATARPLHH